VFWLTQIQMDWHWLSQEAVLPPPAASVSFSSVSFLSVSRLRLSFLSDLFMDLPYR